MEQPQSRHEQPAVDRSDAAFAAADQLIAENPILAENPRVRALRDNDYTLENGTELDPVTFLEKMLDHLSLQNGGQVTQEEVSAAVDVMVAHSLPPELEGMIENRPN